jgi:hypothetical protein
MCSGRVGNSCSTNFRTVSKILLLIDLKIYENSCKTHIRVLSYFVRLILSGNLYTVLKLVEQELPTLPEHMSSPALLYNAYNTVNYSSSVMIKTKLLRKIRQTRTDSVFRGV